MANVRLGHSKFDTGTFNDIDCDLRLPFFCSFKENITLNKMQEITAKSIMGGLDINLNFGAGICIALGVMIVTVVICMRKQQIEICRRQPELTVCESQAYSFGGYNDGSTMTRDSTSSNESFEHSHQDSTDLQFQGNESDDSRKAECVNDSQ